MHADGVTDERGQVDRFCRLGDEAAFRALYGRHTPRLYRVARRFVGDADGSAEDVIQETWITAALRFGSFRWESSLATWLTGIAINHCRERIRLRERGGGQPLAPSREPAAPAREDCRLDVESALLRLAPGYREVLVLHDVEGFTHQEIAQLLEIEAGTSKSQLFRARRALREQLEP